MRRSGFARQVPKRAERPDRTAEFESVVIERPRARLAARLDLEQPAPVEKDTPHYSAAWRAAVRSLGCCVRCSKQFAEQTGPDPAHRNEGKGMGQKVDDCLTAALCRECHRELDQGASMPRDERRRELDRAILRTLVLLFRAGKVMVA